MSPRGGVTTDNLWSSPTREESAGRKDVPTLVSGCPLPWLGFSANPPAELHRVALGAREQRTRF